LRADLKRLARDSGSAVVAAAARPLPTPRSIALHKSFGLGSAVAALAALVALGAAGWWATHRLKPMS
jgi:hypothetical protein